MKFLISIFIISLSVFPVYGAISGNVEKSGVGDSHQVIDSKTGSSVGHADVTLPSKGYKTRTDDDGRFSLGVKVDAPTIMSVQKDGYKPFSLTVDDSSLAKPIVVGIEKTGPNDIVIDKDMYHIGDDNYSEKSANASEFRVKAIGPFYTKNFEVKSVPPNENFYLIIGSVIGIDTKMARDIGQSKVKTAYASPMQVFFNGNMLAELQLNGDNQQIKIPKNLVKVGSNQLTIKAGRNLFQIAYVDYDDIELMNLFLETKVD
jgi:hypothetical protein